DQESVPHKRHPGGSTAVAVPQQRIRQRRILERMNTMTTIRVDQAVRDRLAALAEAHGRSLGAELAAILDDLQWQAIEAGYRRLAAQPNALAAYHSEAETISAADLDELADTAAREYPEYNDAGQ